jgi:hypothetical protein
VRASGTRPSILFRSPCSHPGTARLLAVAAIASAMAVVSPSLALDPVIDRFAAVPDCIFPDPRRGILSYTVSLAARIRIAAIEEIGLIGVTRTFHDVPGSFPSSFRTAIVDPRPSANVVAYELVAIGEDGTAVRRRLDFRYRRAAFDLLPPVSHIRGTGPTASRNTIRVRCEPYQCHLSQLFIQVRSSDRRRGWQGGHRAHFRSTPWRPMGELQHRVAQHRQVSRWWHRRMDRAREGSLHARRYSAIGPCKSRSLMRFAPTTDRIRFIRPNARHATQHDLGTRSGSPYRSAAI